MNPMVTIDTVIMISIHDGKYEIPAQASMPVILIFNRFRMKPRMTIVAPKKSPLLFVRTFGMLKRINGIMIPKSTSSQYKYVSHRGTNNKGRAERLERSMILIINKTERMTTMILAISVNRWSSSPFLKALLLRNDSNITIAQPTPIAEK